MKYLNKITKKLLNQLYIVDKKTTWEIADFLKVGATTIKRYLKFFKIPVRHTRNNKGKNNPFYSKHHTKKAIEKIRIKNLGKKYSEEINKKKGSPLDLNPSWIDGRSFEPYTIEFTDKLKESIRKRDNYECQNCGMTEEEHLIVWGEVLHIHHIDYNKTNCKENNLITTCLSCNTRANFNRDYWQEFFTQKIKELINANKL